MENLRKYPDKKIEASILRTVSEEDQYYLEYQNPSGEMYRVPFGPESSLLAMGELFRAAYCQINGEIDETRLADTFTDPEKRSRLVNLMNTLEKSIRSRNVWVLFFESAVNQSSQ